MYEDQLKEAADALSDKEFEKALGILRPLADQQVPGALGLLGFMYQVGEGVEFDAVKAVQLLTRAAELGDGVAAHNLGTIYVMDLPGVGQDLQLSKYFYRKAKALGAQFAPDAFYE